MNFEPIWEQRSAVAGIYEARLRVIKFNSAGVKQRNLLEPIPSGTRYSIYGCTHIRGFPHSRCMKNCIRTDDVEMVVFTRFQPIWDFIVQRWGGVVSHWLFPAVVGYIAFASFGIYFSLKDIGPWRSVATRINQTCFPDTKEIYRVARIQCGLCIPSSSSYCGKPFLIMSSDRPPPHLSTNLSATSPFLL